MLKKRLEKSVFKEKTGSTLLGYLTMLRKEYASTILNNPEYTIEYFSSKCGFKTSRQLQTDIRKVSRGFLEPNQRFVLFNRYYI